jgi:hypothetical protein
MAYRELATNTERGPIHKWTEVGQSLEGTYLGTREGAVFDGGRRSKLGVIVLETGVQTAFALPTQLGLRLGDIQPGVQLRVTYTGAAKGKMPMPYKTFKVEIDDGGTGVLPPAAASRGGASTGPTGAPNGDLASLRAQLEGKLGKSARAMLGAMEKQAAGDEGKLAGMLQTTLAQLGA